MVVSSDFLDDFILVIARSVSDEAVQLSLTKMDCFAALAMTVLKLRP